MAKSSSATEESSQAGTCVARHTVQAVAKVSHGAAATASGMICTRTGCWGAVQAQLCFRIINGGKRHDCR